MPKDRGVEHVSRQLGDFTALVAQGVQAGQHVKILEAGCGYGVAMMGFVKLFGEAVEVTGINYAPTHGDVETMKETAVEKGLYSRNELDELPEALIPVITFCDASRDLPFRDNTFDFIYSVASLYLFDDKMHFLEECNRILKSEGVARISASLHFARENKGVPAHYDSFWEIWHQGRETKIWDYCKLVPGLDFVWNGSTRDPLAYIELRKQQALRTNLRFIAAVDLNLIWHEWCGIKSIYSTQVDFTPRYR